MTSAASEFAWEGSRVLPFQTLPQRCDHAQPPSSRARPGLMPNCCPRWLLDTDFNLPLKDRYLQKAHPWAQPVLATLRLPPGAPPARGPEFKFLLPRAHLAGASYHLPGAVPRSRPFCCAPTPCSSPLPVLLRAWLRVQVGRGLLVIIF